LSPQVGAALHGHLGGGLGAFAAVDGVAERLPVVAGGHRFFGSLERVSGRGELGGGKAIGAGGARGIDGALGLIHFLAWRFGAPGRKEHDGERQAAAYTTHVSRVY
jgi:hypothetical protein